MLTVSIEKNESKKSKNFLLFAIAGITLVFLISFTISSILIGQGVRKQCKKAQGKYQGDCVVALNQLVDDERNSLDENNQAVWALGQMGDERALPVLEKYFESSEAKCNHDTKLCQYELEKAIKLIKSGFNPTAIVWRNEL